MPDLLSTVTLGQVFWVAAAVTAVVGFVKKVWPWLSRVKDFFDDLMGEPARAGVKARPGVMDRLAANEAAIGEIKELVESAEYHSRPNGGASAYDGLMREVQNIKAGLAAHVVQADGIHEQQAAAIAHLTEALPIVARSTPHPDDATD